MLRSISPQRFVDRSKTDGFKSFVPNSDVAQGLDLFGARRALAQMLFTPSDFFEFRCKRRGIPERPREALVSKNKRVVG